MSSTVASERAQKQAERVAFFSDAVFAIAITLLVLEIKVPHVESPVSEAELANALLALLLKGVGFVVSFLVIGSYWVSHHRAFAWIRDTDSTLLWRNLRLLLCVSFIPFPTAFFSEYPAGRVPLQLYALSLGLVGLAQQHLWAHAFRPGSRLRVPDAPESEIARLRRRGWAAPAVCALAIAVSPWSLVAARSSLLLIPVAVWLLERGRGAGTARKPGR